LNYHNAVIPQGLSFSFKDHTMPTSRFQNNNSSRRRSKSYSDLDEALLDPNEVTPLLLTSRLNDLLRVPIDHGKKVCMTFFYLGMVTMLPWNFLISINAFWNYKFRQVDNDTTEINQTTLAFMENSVSTTFLPPVPIIKPTDMQVSFPSYVAIASNIPGAITTLLHSGFGQRVSVCTRMGWSLTVLFVGFLCLLGVSIPNCDDWQERYLHLVLMLIVLANVGVNVLQGSMFGISGRFPPLYAGAVMIGQAMGGVAPAVAAIALISFEVQPPILGPACFGTILLLLMLAFWMFRLIKHNKFFLYYAEGKDNHGVVEDHDAEVDTLCYKEIFKQSWPYLVAGYVNYATTLMIFPALTSTVESVTKSAWTRNFFTPVAVVLVFNVADLSGRILATYCQWPKRSTVSKYGLLLFCVLRTGLIPLFMFCNAKPESRAMPLLFKSDAVFCTLLSIMGFTVGYLGNYCLTNAPKSAEDPASQEATSLILTACFVFAQASGSFLSYFIVKSV